MDKTNKDILQQFADKLVPEIQGVTKRFAPTIESEVTENSVTIYGSKYIQTLIDGRPPTSSGASKGSPTLQQIILEWIGTKGIQPTPGANGKIPTVEQLSWAISTSIHKNGDLLYQRGGGNDIFKGIITTERIENLVNLFEKKALTEVESIIDIKL